MLSSKLKFIGRSLSIAILLSMAIPTIVLAGGNTAASNDTEDVGGTLTPSDGGDGVLGSNVAIITMRLVDNNSDTDEVNEAIKTHSSDNWSQIGISTVDQYLYTYPEFFTKTSITKTSGIITMDTRDKADGSTNYYMVDGAGNISSSPFANHFSIERDSGSHSSYQPQVIKNAIKSNAALYNSFKSNTLTVAQVKTLLANNTANLTSSTINFVELFQDTGDVGTCLNSMFNSSYSKYDNLLTYLDFLLVVNNVSSKTENATNWKVIENLLKTGNADGSDKFSVVFMAAGRQYSSAGSRKTVYTMPTYYSVATGKAVSSYMNIKGLNTTVVKAINQTSTMPSYTSNPAAWVEKLHDNWNAVSGGVCASGKTRMWGGNRDLQWYTDAQISIAGFENYKAATMLMPTDMFGRQTGNCSYTYFSTEKLKSDPILVEPIGNFKVTATSDTLSVSDSATPVTAKITVNLKQSKTSDISKFKALFAAAAKRGYTKAEMEVQMGFVAVAGTGTSTKPYDSVTGPVSASLSNGKLVVRELTYKELYKYLVGTKVIKFSDTGILISQDTTNKYTGTVTIYFPQDTSNEFGPIQLKAKGKTIESTYMGSDKVSWLYDTSGSGTTGHFYSTPGSPYAEIKEGSPGDETFEAMAGVPTTENLYVGFGASEFMSNMEVKQDTSNGTRKYTLSYTCTKYIGVNERCHIYCRGHTTSTSEKRLIDTTYKDVPDGHGGTTSVVDVPAHDEYYTGSVTLRYGESYTSSTGASYSGTALCPDDKGGCPYHDGAHGCVDPHSVNQAHPITVVYTGTINQPINNFNYTNITGLELWRLSKLDLIGNPELFTNPNQTLTMPTGYNLFYNQDGYVSGNGRLVFDWNLNPSQKYGDTTIGQTDDTMMLATECDQTATAWMNDNVNGASVTATVVSDYAVLGTTEGYQSMMYNTYKSDTVPLGVTFSTGSVNKTLNANPITFSDIPTWDEFWTSNALSAAQWQSTHLVRSGYNGKYYTPTDKYVNGNVVIGTDPASVLGAHPNTLSRTGTTSFTRDAANMRMVRTGLNIIDSTNTVTKEWDSSDGIEPISNGEWDTGNAFVEAEKVVTYGTTGGNDYATEVDGLTYKEEAKYADECTEVNDIVVHNPSSSQLATVISSDSKYDQRTTTSLAEGGDPSGGEGEITLGNGQVVSTNDIFVNLDRQFQIYFPDMGDFAENPSLWGILNTTAVRGKGFTDGMNTTKWVRDKYVIFQVNVIDENGKTWLSNTEIPLDTLPNHGGYYNFYCVLGNYESANSRVTFISIASNADEIDYYTDNSQTTNKTRNEQSLAAFHTSQKNQYMDVVGSIGSLTINDSGDFRFANLFKQPDAAGGWLIPNLVPKVNVKLPNKVASDLNDVRGEAATEDTDYHSTYGATYAASGGKAYPFVLLPLTPSDNNIAELRNQPMRPGYNLYMDVETNGSYYGENRNPSDFTLQDSSLYYKMQITPRYWRLNLDTGVYTPADVYMGREGEYTPVVYFDDALTPNEYYLYLDWAKESARRNYTADERITTAHALEMMTGGMTIPSRSPSTATKDVIGTADRLFLNDLDRTFIGTEFTYGEDRNPLSAIPNWMYRMQSQRWHFTLGLPSSAVFVEANQPCTSENIKLFQTTNSVIVCAIDIKVKGNVWTLEYDGTSINTSDGAGFRVIGGGRVYTPPIDPVTGLTLTDPIVAVYSNKFTSSDDLRTEGSH